MPLPTVETVRLAIQKALVEGLEGEAGTWTARVGKNEVEFHPGREISVDVCLDDEEIHEARPEEPIEKEYRFRVVVEAIEE